jgi:hypothetical protein
VTGTIDDPGQAGTDRSVSRPSSATDRVGAAIRRNRIDLLLAALVAATAALLAFVVQRRTGRIAWEENDYWFDFDTHRVGLQMTSRDMVSSLNTNLHPGFILFTNLPLSVLAPLSDVQKLTVEVCAASALWMTAFFAMLRFLGVRRFDALLFTAIAGASATSLFLGPVPESYTAATAGLVIVLAVVAWDREQRSGPIPYVVAGLFAMGVTLINGIVVGLAVAVRFWWRRAIVVLAIIAIGLVVMSGLQRLVFPDSRFIVGSSSETNIVSESLFTEQAGGPVRVASSFLFHGVVAPDLGTKVKDPTGEILLTFQDSNPGSGSPAGVLAIVAWLVVLAVGAWALLRTEVATRHFRLVLGLTIAATLLFLFGFGQDTFTFSPFVTPLLVTVAALGTLTRFRRFVLVVGAVLFVTELANNVMQLDDAEELVRLLRSAGAFL